MFDAKSILEALVNGAGPRQAAQPAGGGGLGDILGQLARAAQGGAAGAPQARQADSGLGGLGDLLGKLIPQAGSAPAHAAPSDGGLGGLGDLLGKLQQQAGGAASSGAGGLGDILGKLQQQASGAANNAGLGGGNLMDILTKVLGQATEGAREGAGRIGTATGASDALGKAMGGMSGDDILAKLKDLVAQNQLGAGAAAGGLGAVVLGTQAGRSIAASAAKLGALALIGGLAYKALLNYQNGQPLITGAHSVTEAAPQGTGFEPAAVTNDSAILYIRAMIAAAAADGRIDQAEMANIMGGLKQGGLEADAEEFLAAEFNAPASIDDLANACQSSEQAVQVYTAARLAISPDSRAESAFLAGLAERLGVDATLAAHIDSATRNAA
ncbi:MAG: DUF533 domain-containing protein [Hyphomicrobiaceae bacterium]